MNKNKKTNSKEVILKIRKHILEFQKLRGSKIEKLTYQEVKEQVQNGEYLIFNDDIIDFLNSLKINEEKKIYSIEKSLALYYHLVAREYLKLFNLITKKNK